MVIRYYKLVNYEVEIKIKFMLKYMIQELSQLVYFLRFLKLKNLFKKHRKKKANTIY